jgi:hypothetical protein
MAGIKGRSGRKPKWTDEQIEEAAESLLDWLEEDPDNHLWFRDWAIENGIPAEYLSRWSAKNNIFRQAMETAEMAQEARLVNGGLRNKLNARIVALVLESRHGWAGRQSLELSQSPQELRFGSVEECDETIRAAEARRTQLQEMLEEANRLAAEPMFVDS